MAFILIDDYKPMIVSPKVGAYLWMIKKGYVQPKQKAWRNYAERVKKVYLSQNNAPDDYIAERKAYLHDDKPVRVEKWIPIETRKDLM